MILAIHIIGAISTFTAGVFSRKLLRIGVVFEFVTGTILSINAGSSVLGYCAKMGLYLALWLGLEGMHIIRNERQASRLLKLEQKEH
jgi:hypothetical protein